MQCILFSILVIARSGSDEAIQLPRKPPWIASLALAMTKRKIVLAARSTPSPRVRGEGWDEGALPLGAAQRPRPLTRSLRSRPSVMPEGRLSPRAAEVKELSRAQTNKFVLATLSCARALLHHHASKNLRPQEGAERRKAHANHCRRAGKRAHLRHSSAFGRQRALSGRARLPALCCGTRQGERIRRWLSSSSRVS